MKNCVYNIFCPIRCDRDANAVCVIQERNLTQKSTGRSANRSVHNNLNSSPATRTIPITSLQEHYHRQPEAGGCNKFFHNLFHAKNEARV